MNGSRAVLDSNVIIFLKKIRLPDAIILATACHLNADLVTDDWDDFSGIDETVKVVDLSFAK